MKKITKIGFKRIINKKYKIPKGMNRQFVMCNKCKEKAYYDYVPYSLGNPIMVANCGHFFKDNYKPF